MKKIVWVLILSVPFLISFNSISAQTKLLIGVTSNKTVYKTGEPIAFALTVLNQKSSPTKVIFSSGRKYDFYLYKDEKLLWKWSDGMMFTMAISKLKLEPKKPVTYVVTYPAGPKPEPGKYKLVGVFCTREKEYLSEPVEIEIK